MRIRNNEKGFSPVEIALLVVIVGAIGFVGWYVYQAKNNTDKVLSSSSVHNNSDAKVAATSSATSATKATSASTSSKAAVNTSALQSSLNAVTSSVSQNTSDINNANNAVNDQSGFTSVPQ